MLFGSIAQASPLDLSSWSPKDWNLREDRTESGWQIHRNNTSYAYQTRSVGPTAYLNNLSQSNFTMEGTFKICTPALFGAVGFVFGYQDPSHFYLFEWKIYNSDSVGKGGIGFAVKRFSAPSLGDLKLSDFQSPHSTQYMEVLAEEYNSYERLSAFNEYNFHLNYEPGFINLRLGNNNTARSLWDVTVEDNAYHYGQFGFYNFEQGMAVYFGFAQAGGVLEPPSNGNEVPVPEPGTVLLLGPSLAMFLLLGRRLRAQGSKCI